MPPFNCIMLVDDDPVQIFINKKLLAKFQLTQNVIAVSNGQDGLVKLVELNNHPELCPQVIFLDINMPVMDGFEFVECFNQLTLEKKDEIQIAVLSSSDNANDMKKMKSLGIEHYFNKPLNELMLQQMGSGTNGFNASAC